jgi:hypothetical protein
VPQQTGLRPGGMEGAATDWAEARRPNGDDSNLQGYLRAQAIRCLGIRKRLGRAAAIWMPVGPWWAGCRCRHKT